MSRLNRINSLLILLLLFSFGLACGGRMQTAEADKLVDEANRMLKEAGELTKKNETRNQNLFSAPLETTAQLQDYKAKMKDEAQGIVNNFAQAAEEIAAAGKKFGEAAELNVPEKFKEYLNIKAQEFAKRAEAVNTRKENARAFVDFDDPSVMNKRFQENNTKAEKLTGEADELGAKAETIRATNKDIFKF